MIVSVMILCNHHDFASQLWSSVVYMECWNIRSQDYSFPGTFVPMMELSFSRLFILWNIRSLDCSLPGTFIPKTNKHCRHFPPRTIRSLDRFIPWNFRSRYPGPFLPRTIRSFVGTTRKTIGKLNKAIDKLSAALASVSFTTNSNGNNSTPRMAYTAVRNERSRERKFQGTNSPGNECSRERMVLRTKVPSWERMFQGTNSLGNEYSWYRLYACLTYKKWTLCKV